MQEVISNLMISRIEVRGEEDADVAPYRHVTEREVLVVRPCQEVGAARSMLMQSFRHVMAQLAHTKVPFTPGSKSLPVGLAADVHGIRHLLANKRLTLELHQR